MYGPGGLPEPDDIRRAPDTGPAHRDSVDRGGLLSNLTVSIGKLILKCKLEIQRVGAAEPESAPVLRNRQAWRPRLGISATWPRSRPGFRGGSYQNQAAGSHRQELGKPGQLNADPVVFWEALDAIEREAFRSFAYSRTFAAGARLIEEGDQADHVIVILSGRTKICVDERGRERILAERGPGQLVGERGALQISVRSASVIALETVRTLVARTRDFAAFLTDHPRVLDIVERQVYDRLTEDAARYGPDTLGNVPVDRTPAPGRLGHSLSAGRPAQHPRPLNGENCTVILSDVVGFGAWTRNDEDRSIIREALFSMTHTVLQGLPDAWSWDDRGDGLLTVVSPSVPTAKVLAYLHKELPAALDEHNRAYPESARIQLRVAINVGPVASDTMGVSGEAIIVTARLIEAPAFKNAMGESEASLGIIASPFIYESVIRHGPYVEGYSEIRADVKESSIVAWIMLFDRSLSSSGHFA